MKLVRFRKEERPLSNETKKSQIDLDASSRVIAEKRLDMAYLIRAFQKYDASDLHLRKNRPPLYRLNGKLLPASMPVLNEAQIKELVLSIVPPSELEKLENEHQVDFTFVNSELGRFRCNLFYSMGSLSAAIRRIPISIPPLEQLGVPEVMKDLVSKSRGLLLVTGATGSGKSTTLAALVNYLNENHRVHIVTLEDPIEFIFQDTKATITQREKGSDFGNIQDALTACLRQDPDVIVVGEMRDYLTIQAALTAAETGHLVISTLHTKDAKSAIERILDVFQPEQQNQIRVQLAGSLIGVLSQTLIPKADGTGRILATEMLVKSPSIENCIRKGQGEFIQELMQKSDLYYHMHTMNMDLERLIRAKIITAEEGLSFSSSPDDLSLRLSGIDRT